MCRLTPAIVQIAGRSGGVRTTRTCRTTEMSVSTCWSSQSCRHVHSTVQLQYTYSSHYTWHLDSVHGTAQPNGRALSRPHNWEKTKTRQRQKQFLCYLYLNFANDFISVVRTTFRSVSGSSLTTTKIYGVKFYSMDLDNDVRTTKRDPRNAIALDRSKLRSYLLPFVHELSSIS